MGFGGAAQGGAQSSHGTILSKINTTTISRTDPLFLWLFYRRTEFMMDRQAHCCYVCVEVVELSGVPIEQLHLLPPPLRN
eukprot:3621333-Amphidinium_carterae.2